MQQRTTGRQNRLTEEMCKVRRPPLEHRQKPSQEENEDPEGDKPPQSLLTNKR